MAPSRLQAKYKEQVKSLKTPGGAQSPMLRSYRILFLVVGLITASLSQPGQAGQAKESNAATGVQQSLEDIASALKEANKADNTTKPCPKKQDNRESDLCAQWKAADAAETSAYWTKASFWLGLGGLVVGFCTLIAAAAAAKFAKDAAIHTDKGNDIAQSAQRAWVTVKLQPKTLRATPEKGLDIHFDIVVENIGQTVASHFDVEATAFAWSMTGGIEDRANQTVAKIKEWAKGHSIDKHSSLIPKDSQSFPKQVVIKPDDIPWTKASDWEDPKVQVVVVCAVMYRVATKPEVTQVSSRSWYLGEKRADGGTRFRIDQKCRLSGQWIATDSFFHTLSHEEYPANDDSQKNDK